MAKARPKQASAPSSSSIPKTLPIHVRKWIDVESERQHARSYPIAKKMNTLLRHGHLPRKEDGAIEFMRLKPEFGSDFPHSVHWSIRTWKDHLARGGGPKTRVQYCTDSTDEEILYL